MSEEEINKLFASVQSRLSEMRGDSRERYALLVAGLKDSFNTEAAAHVRLAEFGWYVHQEMVIGDVWSVLSLVAEGNHQAVDNAMAEMLRKDLNRIEARVRLNKKLTSTIIDEAFLAHRNGMYHSSTVLFLVQADGACDGKLMRRDRGKYLKRNSNARIANEVLDRVGPLFERSRGRIVHGMDNSFGTEIVSLQALSLLCFVLDMVGRYNGKRL